MHIARDLNSSNLNLPDPEIGVDISSWERKEEGLLIPPNEASKLEVLRACHDSGIAGHWGRHRTQELISRNFWWAKWQGKGAGLDGSH